MAEEVKAEEVKQEEKKGDAKKIMSTIFKIIIGLGFLILAILAIIGWWADLKVVFKGCIGLFLLLAALIAFAIAKE